MNKNTGNKKQGGFTERLIGYAVEAAVLRKCADHPGSVFRTDADIEDAYAAIKKAWQTGRINSDYESAAGQLNDIVAKAPRVCSHTTCWTN